MNIEGLLNTIDSRYNADFDCSPTGPHVTWAEHNLMLAVRLLNDRVIALERRLAELEDAPALYCDLSLYED